MIRFLIWALILGGAGYSGFQYAYQQDWRLRQQARQTTVRVQEWWGHLWAPVQSDTSVMDARHEEKLRAFGRSANRSNRMLMQQHQGPLEPVRDEVGNPGSWGALTEDGDEGGIYEREE